MTEWNQIRGAAAAAAAAQAAAAFHAWADYKENPFLFFCMTEKGL